MNPYISCLSTTSTEVTKLDDGEGVWEGEGGGGISFKTTNRSDDFNRVLLSIVH